MNKNVSIPLPNSFITNPSTGSGWQKGKADADQKRQYVFIFALQTLYSNVLVINAVGFLK